MKTRGKMGEGGRGLADLGLIRHRRDVDLPGGYRVRRLEVDPGLALDVGAQAGIPEGGINEDAADVEITLVGVGPE